MLAGYVKDRAPRGGTQRQAVVASDVAGAVDFAGMDPTLERRTQQDALRSPIADRHGNCDWTVDHARWGMTRYHLEEQTFSGRTLEEGLAWRLVWLMRPELGIGPFVA